MGRIREEDDKVTMTLRDPLAARIKKDKKLQKKLKSPKPQGDYKTKAQAKRAFLSGLIHHISKQSKGGAQESDAQNMISLVVEGYDPFEVVEKFPDMKKKFMKKKDDEDDYEDDDE